VKYYGGTIMIQDLLNNIRSINEIVNESEQLFQSEPQYYSEKNQDVLEEKIRKFLNFEKPKIMVAGIYSAGKSTLINILCRKNVAEVSARPQTDKISEYNYNDYILVDSPGVDAPIEHEKITDEYVSKCHVLLFVISTGAFESVKNYSKMYDWIKTGNPFIIVVNDKIGYKDFNVPEITELKNKIIKNLRYYSNDNKIGDKYDVIVVNAKRAEKGIFENKPKLYELSNLKMLEERISRIMQRRNALKLLVAPVNNLIQMLDDFENFQANKVTSLSEDFDNSIFRLQAKRNSLAENIKINIRGIVDSKKDILINGYANGKDNSSSVFESIQAEIAQLYSGKVSELILFIKSHFKGIEVNIGENFNISSGNTINVEISKSASKIDSQNNAVSSNSSESDNLGMGSIGAGAAASVISGNPIPVLATIAIAIKKFIDRDNDKQQKEYEALVAQAEESNRRAREEADEKLRIRQDIRIQVETQCDRLINNLADEIIKNIYETADGVINQLISLSEENEALKNDIESKIKTTQKLKNRLVTIKNMTE